MHKEITACTGVVDLRVDRTSFSAGMNCLITSSNILNVEMCSYSAGFMHNWIIKITDCIKLLYTDFTDSFYFLVDRLQFLLFYKQASSELFLSFIFYQGAKVLYVLPLIKLDVIGFTKYLRKLDDLAFSTID